MQSEKSTRKLGSYPLEKRLLMQNPAITKRSKKQGGVFVKNLA
jgi:hypothetical protein